MAEFEKIVKSEFCDLWENLRQRPVAAAPSDIDFVVLRDDPHRPYDRTIPGRVGPVSPRAGAKSELCFRENVHHRP
jgi:hypothetical protein